MKDLPLLNLSLKRHRDLLIERINASEGIHRVELVKVRDQRSTRQNAYYFGVALSVICPGLSDCEGREIDTLEAHEFFKMKFLRRAMVNKRTGDVIGGIVRSTTDLDVAEFGEYLQRIIEFAYDMLGIVVPPATEYREVAKT